MTTANNTTGETGAALFAGFDLARGLTPSERESGYLSVFGMEWGEPEKITLGDMGKLTARPINLLWHELTRRGVPLDKVVKLYRRHGRARVDVPGRVLYLAAVKDRIYQR